MINPGDIVVCVNLESPCRCGDRAASLCPVQPIIGRYYKVFWTGDAGCRKCGVVVPCLSTPDLEAFANDCAWPQSIFRKVTKADTDIFLMADAPREKETV